MSKIEENFMAWLHNAHAMEEQAVTMLTSLASRTRDYPEVKTRVESHLTETRRQIEALEECIRRHGGENLEGRGREDCRFRPSLRATSKGAR
jgi:ferritin-like metal-binding protein YciE